MAEQLAVLFRDRTADGASEQAKAWARAEGLTVRTVARIRQRDDLPTWGADDDPCATLWAWEVTLAVVALPAEVALPTLPEAPSLPLWGSAL